MAFLNFHFLRQLRALDRRWRNSAAVAGSSAGPNTAGVWAAFCHWQMRFGSMLSARAAAWADRLCAARRRASARKAASFLRR